MTTIGVLALQGDFEAHRRALEEAGASAPRVLRPSALEGLDGLVIPGGESTTLVTLARDGGWIEPIRSFHESGGALFGTCAGAILLASRVRSPEQLCLGLIDIEVERNAYGRQRESFETATGRAEPGSELEGPDPIEMVLIRAPRIRTCGGAVRVLMRLGGEPVLVRQGRVLAGTFHPELGRDRRVHRYFSGIAAGALKTPACRRLDKPGGRHNIARVCRGGWGRSSSNRGPSPKRSSTGR